MKEDCRNKLNRALASAKSPKEVGEFLQSILSTTEYDEISKRWEAMILLIKGISQKKIRENLKVSIATVTRCSNELHRTENILKKFYKRTKQR